MSSSSTSGAVLRKVRTWRRHNTPTERCRIDKLKAKRLESSSKLSKESSSGSFSGMSIEGRV